MLLHSLFNKVCAGIAEGLSMMGENHFTLLPQLHEKRVSTVESGGLCPCVLSLFLLEETACDQAKYLIMEYVVINTPKLYNTDDL